MSLPARAIAAGVVVLVILTGHPPQPAGAQRTPATGWPTEPAAPRLSPQALENVEARIATATRILDRLESDAKGRGLQNGWRRSSLDRLLPLSLAALTYVEQRAFSLDALTEAIRDAADDPQLIGETDADLVYTPIAPCRFIDTRQYAGGKINGVRAFDADLNGSAYGGAGSCDPRTAFGVGSASKIGALAMNLTVADTSAAVPPGFAAAKPTAASPTTSLLNWYESGALVQVANQAIVTTAQDPAFGAPEFVIQTSGSVHVIVDLFGAFITPQATALEVLTLESTVNIGANSTWNSTSPSCPVGYARTGGGCQIGAPSYLNASKPSDTGNAWFCSANNTTAFTTIIRMFVICARVPGR